MKYSIIDISSNSLSAIVASAEGDRTEIVFKERAAVSLVRYLGDGKLLPRGMDKLIETLTEIRENCRRIGAERCYLISTAAFRNVENFEEIYDKVLAATGLPVNALDGATEAYCDYVANVYYSSCEKPVLIDLGGKSMEICDLSETEKEKMLSGKLYDTSDAELSRLHTRAHLRRNICTAIDHAVDRAARHASSRRNRPDGRFVGFHLSIPCLSWSVDGRVPTVPNVSSIAQTRFWHKARKTFHSAAGSLVAFDKRKGAHRASFTNLQRAVDIPVLVR